MKILGVVTARGGSKRVPGKNIALLGGKPLIAWTIEAALASCDKVVTSTDSNDIASVARQCGTDIVFCPLDLEQPDQHLPQLRHAVEHTIAAMSGYWNLVDTVALLQPTSPFRTANDITQCARKMEECDATSVISVVEFQAQNTVFTLGHGDRMRCITERVYAPTRTYQPKIYLENGAVFLTRLDHLLQGGGWYDPLPYAYVMPPQRSLDIDTRADFDAAVSMVRGDVAMSAAPLKKLVAFT